VTLTDEVSGFVFTSLEGMSSASSLLLAVMDGSEMLPCAEVSLRGERGATSRDAAVTDGASCWSLISPPHSTPDPGI
jgi:hypothetical protein